jgi:uncharacterized membrane-anchored protein
MTDARMSAEFPQHPERQLLQDEAHARPPLPIPFHHAEVWHWVLFSPPAGSTWPEGIDPRQSHQRVSLPDGLLRIEKHTEFYALTFLGEGPPGAASLALIGACPGQQLAGLRIAVRPDSSAAIEREIFGDALLYGGDARGGKFRLTTDFEIAPNGLVTFLVSDKYTEAYSRGRVVKRLSDIETYRMASLLALPLVRSCYPQLEALEKAAAEATNAISQAQDEGLDTQISVLSRLQAEAGSLRERVRYRIAASLAYEDIVNTRVGGLDEAEIGERRTITSFLRHRLKPAMNTVRAFDRRLRDLQETISAAMALARTRIDVRMEAQNQALLASMERRARQQVQLGQAVEGLSVAAITYYISGLLGYFLKGVPDFGISDEVLTGLAVPVIAVAVYLIAQRAKRHIDKL